MKGSFALIEKKSSILIIVIFVFLFFEPALTSPFTQYLLLGIVTQKVFEQISILGAEV